MSAQQPQSLPPAEGVLWLRASWQYFRARPMRWMGLTAGFLLLIQFLSMIKIGVLLVPLLKPILTVGFLAAAWHQERGQEPALPHLFAGFKSNWKALVPLGLVYFAGLACAVTLAGVVSGVSPETFLAAQNAKDTPAVMQMALSAMTWSLLFMLPVVLALWFAPALIVFDDMGVRQALTTSLHGCVRNVPALLVYAITLFAAATLVSFVVLILSKAAPAVGQVSLFFIAIPFMTILFITDYVSYRRVFHYEQPLQVPA